MPRRFGLVSDTHGRFHPELPSMLAGVEAILHAGDVCGDEVLDQLGLIAPTFAVAGNCDRVSPRLPLSRRVELPFGVAAIAHGHLHPPDIGERVVALVRSATCPRLRLVLTGHSHEALLREVDGVLVVNPGAASPPRLGKDSSVALLAWDDSTDRLSVEFHPLTW